MYGTIARIKIDPTRVEELKALGDSMGVAPGQIGGYVFQMDADPGVFYLVAVFESKEAYWANARSPEQNERFLRLRALLLDDPEWHDGAIVRAAGRSQP
jgi:quinol monooxygenase YgiN